MLSGDLVVAEFLKEARILKRQMQLMKNNMEHVPTDDLLKILTISKAVEKEFNELKKNSEVVLEQDGYEGLKSLWYKKMQ